MNYLLDAHACLALIRDHPYKVRTRFHRALHAGSTVGTSSLVIFELWTRVAENQQAQKEIMDIFLGGPIHIVSFGEEDALAAVSLGQEMRARNVKLEDMELLVAGQAQARKSTLVTAGIKLPGFKNLNWRDWGR